MYIGRYHAHVSISKGVIGYQFFFLFYRRFAVRRGKSISDRKTKLLDFFSKKPPFNMSFFLLVIEEIAIKLSMNFAQKALFKPSINQTSATRGPPNISHGTGCICNSIFISRPS